MALCFCPINSFAHGKEELKLRLDLQKTKLCEAWMRGNCSDTNCCKFFCLNESFTFLVSRSHIPTLLFYVLQITLTVIMNSKLLVIITRLDCVNSGNVVSHVKLAKVADMHMDIMNSDQEGELMRILSDRSRFNICLLT